MVQNAIMIFERAWCGFNLKSLGSDWKGKEFQIVVLAALLYIYVDLVSEVC